MKLVFASHTAYLQGGAQNCLLDLIKGIKIANPQYEIYIIFPELEALIELFKPYINGYIIIKQPYWMVKPGKKSFKKGVSRFIKIERYVWKILSYLRKISPDVVLTNTIASPVTALACKLGRYKHLWFIHEIPSVSKSYEFLYPEKYIVRVVAFFSSKVLAVSDSVLLYYEKLMTNKDKINRIHYAVEIKNIKDSPERNSNIYTLLLVGNFDLNKGQVEAIRACQEYYASTQKKFRLLLVGAIDDNYSNHVRNLVQNENLCHFVEIVDFTQDISSYYMESDVLLMCSASEGLPRVVVEAQKYGLPVIATSIDANKELLVDGYNGLFYDRGDIGGLARAIQHLSNKEIRDQMGKNALSFMSQRYTLEQFVCEFERMCHSA